MADRPTCKTCRWWEPLGRGIHLQGCCRRLPPRVAVIPARGDLFEELAQQRQLSQPEAEFLTVWPTTQAAEWCGEHAPIT